MGRLIDGLRAKRNGGGPVEASGWSDLSEVSAELWGLGPLGHLALGMVRMAGPDPMCQVFDPAGRPAGIVGLDARSGGLLADFGGQGLLAGGLPDKRVALPAESWLYRASTLRHYPFTGVSRALIVGGMEATVRAAVWACRVSTVERWQSGIPVVGFLPDAADLLADVRWPKGCTLLVRDGETAERVKAEVWGHNIECLVR